MKLVDPSLKESVPWGRSVWVHTKMQRGLYFQVVSKTARIIVPTGNIIMRCID
jgi:hypothetical protein